MPRILNEIVRSRIQLLVEVYELMYTKNMVEWYRKGRLCT
jgi:hypothetical protein